MNLQEYKFCYNCKISKHKTEFHKRLNDVAQYCKECSNINALKYRNTLNGYFNTLYGNAKRHAKERFNKGKIEEGQFTITKQDLLNLFKKQKELCYYSNIKMVTISNSNWQVSLERLDVNKGYTINNIVLCCLEFNGSYQWSHYKIEEMINLLNNKIKQIDIDFNLYKKVPRILNKTKSIINGIEYINCCLCDKVKIQNLYIKDAKNVVH